MNKLIKLFIVLVLLSSCAKDYNFNPWTTVLNQLVKVKYE